MTGFSQRLELRQSQKLIMTPRMQQAMKILRLSNLDLGDFVDDEIRENPLLERADVALGKNDRRTMSSGTIGRPRLEPELLAAEFSPDAPEHWQSEWGEDGDRGVDFGEEPQSWHGRNGGLYEGARPGLDQFVTRPMTLREHLIAQIGADLRDPGDRVIALHLLDLLDEEGYLRVGLDREAGSSAAVRPGRRCAVPPPAIRSHRVSSPAT